MANEHCCGVDGHIRWPRCDFYDTNAKCAVCGLARGAHNSSPNDNTKIYCYEQKTTTFTSEKIVDKYDTDDDGSEENLE